MYVSRTVLLISVLCFAAAVQAETMPGVPSSAWLFDDETANDAFGSVNGTLKNIDSTNFSDTGKPLTDSGDYLTLNGTDEYISFADVYDFESDDPYSISFWVNCADDIKGVVLGKQTLELEEPRALRGWKLMMREGKVDLNIRECYQPTPQNDLQVYASSVPNNDWTHVLVTYAGVLETADDILVYIDGTEITGANITRTTSAAWASDPDGHQITNAEKLAISAYNGEPNIVIELLAGKLDEVAIWDGTVLTGDNAEWLAAHSVGTIPEPSTLVLLAVGGLGLLLWCWRKRFAK